VGGAAYGATFGESPGTTSGHATSSEPPSMVIGETAVQT
jgi:hypothetical protein